MLVRLVKKQLTMSRTVVRKVVGRSIAGCHLATHSLFWSFWKSLGIQEHKEDLGMEEREEVGQHLFIN
jgi:hypothetical protein